MSNTTNGFVAVAEKLSKHFKSGSSVIQAVDAVDLHLSRGSLVAIMGPSGCGKSTLLNLLGALDRADGGRLQVDRRRHGSSRRQEVAYRRDKARVRLPAVQPGYPARWRTSRFPWSSPVCPRRPVAWQDASRVGLGRTARRRRIRRRAAARGHSPRRGGRPTHHPHDSHRQSTRSRAPLVDLLLSRGGAHDDYPYPAPHAHPGRTLSQDGTGRLSEDVRRPPKGLIHWNVCGTKSGPHKRRRRAPVCSNDAKHRQAGPCLRRGLRH
jgi:energy-coupling factor transporter ATP-binding protein EcfA2